MTTATKSEFLALRHGDRVIIGRGYCKWTVRRSWTDDQGERHYRLQRRDQRGDIVTRHDVPEHKLTRQLHVEGQRIVLNSGARLGTIVSVFDDRITDPGYMITLDDSGDASYMIYSNGFTALPD